MVNRSSYFIWFENCSINIRRELSRPILILDFIFEGKVKETCKQLKGSKPAKVERQIWQASNDHKQAIKKIRSEKTPKYSEETALKAKKGSRKRVNLLYKSRAEVFMDDKK